MMENRQTEKLLIENASQVLTMQGDSNHEIGLIENGSVYVEGETIRAVGSSADVAASLADLSDVHRIDEK